MFKKILLLTVFITTQLLAHPHVFVDVKPQVTIDKGNHIVLKMNWAFDEFFSNQIMMDCNISKGKPLTKANIAKIKSTYFKYLKNFNYFTNIKINQAPQTFSVENFKAKIENNKMNYTFDLKLSSPHKDEELAILLEVNDSTNFTALTPGAKLKFPKGFSAVRNEVSKAPCRYNAFLLKAGKK